MYVAFPKVDKCCCGISLRLGSKLIGGYTLLCGTLVTGVAVYEMACNKVGKYVVEVPVTSKLELVYYYIGVIFLLFVGLALLTSGGLLFYAILRERYSCILPFFGIISVVQLMDVVGFFFFFIQLFSDPGISCIFLIGISLNTAVILYCFLIVFSYYRDVTWSSLT